jgi:hypothetical protein
LLFLLAVVFFGAFSIEIRQTAFFIFTFYTPLDLDRSEEWVPYDCFFSGRYHSIAIDFGGSNHDTLSV